MAPIEVVDVVRDEIAHNLRREGLQAQIERFACQHAARRQRLQRMEDQAERVGQRLDMPRQAHRDGVTIGKTSAALTGDGDLAPLRPPDIRGGVEARDPRIGLGIRRPLAMGGILRYGR